MNMHRSFLSLVLILSISLSIIGCGESAPEGVTQEPSSEVENNIDDSEKEVPVQDEIENGEETAQIQEETSVSESEIESEESVTDYSDNSVQETESYGSGDFQDYWMGDDYFDIEGYLRDNGAERIYGTNGDMSPNPAEENITIYVGEFYNQKWEVFIICDAGLTLGHVYVDEEGWLKKNPHYMLSCPPDELGDKVKVDNKGTTANYGVLVEMDTVVQYMKANPDSDDPLSGSGLRYTNNPI